jgi:hypothetical protein
MSELGILGIALFILALLIALFIWWTIRYLLIKLPEQQKEILDKFSPYIMNQIALEYASLPEREQRRVAEDKMRMIFEDRSITSPGDSMIEVALANAFYHRKMLEDNQWIEELKIDQLVQSTTAHLPITPREKEWIL